MSSLKCSPVIQTLEHCIVQLIKASLPQVGVTEIDAILCISAGIEEQIVLKIHEKGDASLAANPVALSCVSKWKKLLNIGESKNLDSPFVSNDGNQGVPFVSTKDIQQVLERALGDTEAQGAGEPRMTSVHKSPTATSVERDQSSSGGFSSNEKLIPNSEGENENDGHFENQSKSLDSTFTDVSSHKDQKKKKDNGCDGALVKCDVGKPPPETLLGMLETNNNDASHPVEDNAGNMTGTVHSGTQSSVSHEKNSETPKEKCETSSCGMNNVFVCEYCCVSYSDGSLLGRHNSEVHGAKTCSVCWCSFTTESKYCSHMKNHSHGENVPKICEEVLVTDVTTRNADVSNSIKCGVCGQPFDREDPGPAQQHLVTLHDFQHLYTCVLCEEYFPSRMTFALHRQVKHSTVAQCKCPSCGLGFSSEEYPHHQGECWSQTSSSGGPVHERDQMSAHTNFTGEPPNKMRCLKGAGVVGHPAILNQLQSQTSRFANESQIFLMQNNLCQNTADGAQAQQSKNRTSEILPEGYIRQQAVKENMLSPAFKAIADNPADMYSYHPSEVQHVNKGDMLSKQLSLKENCPGIGMKGRNVLLNSGGNSDLGTECHDLTVRANQMSASIPSSSQGSYGSIQPTGTVSSENNGLNQWSAFGPSVGHSVEQQSEGNSVIPIPHSSPIQCKLCFIISENYDAFDKHCHEVHNRFTCSFCAQTFASRRNLRRHQRKHTGECPYVCPECSAGFERLEELNKHKQSSHHRTLPEVKYYSCAYCAMSFIADSQVFLTHLQVHHGPQIFGKDIDEEIKNHVME